MITTPEEYFNHRWGIETQENPNDNEPEQIRRSFSTAEEYFKYLWGIDSETPVLNEYGEPEIDEEGNVVMRKVNPFNNVPQLSIFLPSDENTFDVDLNTRTITVPTFLSVAKDHRAETIYFRLDRYYEYQDLTNTTCIIEFINAAGDGGFYLVPFVDVSTFKADDKILIPWCIEGDVTKAAGPVQFVLRFYKVDDAAQKFTYNIRTMPATAQVLVGMDESLIDADIDYDKTANFVQQINDRIENAESTIYWTDLPSYY